MPWCCRGPRRMRTTVGDQLEGRRPRRTPAAALHAKRQAPPPSWAFGPPRCQWGARHLRRAPFTLPLTVGKSLHGPAQPCSPASAATRRPGYWHCGPGKQASQGTAISAAAGPSQRRRRCAPVVRHALPLSIATRPCGCSGRRPLCCLPLDAQGPGQRQGMAQHQVVKVPRVATRPGQWTHWTIGLIRLIRLTGLIGPRTTDHGQ